MRVWVTAWEFHYGPWTMVYAYDATIFARATENSAQQSMERGKKFGQYNVVSSVLRCHFQQQMWL